MFEGENVNALVVKYSLAIYLSDYDFLIDYALSFIKKGINPFIIPAEAIMDGWMDKKCAGLGWSKWWVWKGL